jgi:hypothetical protein
MKIAYKYILVVIWIGIMLSFAVPFVIASTETYKSNVNVELGFTCTLNNAIPSALANMNITVKYPNGSSFLNNVIATPLGNGAFKYNTNFPDIGLYNVQVFCWDGTYSFSNSDNYYDVSATGKELTSAKATSYVIIFVISFLVLIGFLILGFYIPGNNKSDAMTGYIIAVSNLKYVKMLCFAFAYLTALFISYFSWMVCYAYLDMDFATTMFRFMFTAQLYLILPLFIIGIYVAVTNIIRDNEIGEFLGRGLKTRGDK